MNKFNQDKFESKAKKLVAEHYKVNEKELFVVWFCKAGANAKVMIYDMDDHCFEVTYFGKDKEYIVDVYNIVECGMFFEEVE